MEVEADIEPVKIRLDRRSFRFTARLRSAPHSHPLRGLSDKISKRFSRRLPKNLRHASQVVYLLKAYPDLRENVETIYPMPIPPCEEGLGVDAEIATSREEGQAVTDRTMASAGPTTLILFTDGSQLSDQESGFACVLRKITDGHIQYRATRVSTDSWRTVYETEVQAIAWALSWAIVEIQRDSGISEVNHLC